MHEGVSGTDGGERLGMRGHGWQRRHLGRGGRVILGRGSGWEIDPMRRPILEDDRKWAGELLLFCTSHFAPCPIVLECLECPGTNTLVDPARVKDDFTLLTGILAEQVLTRLFMGVN